MFHLFTASTANRGEERSAEIERGEDGLEERLERSPLPRRGVCQDSENGLRVNRKYPEIHVARRRRTGVLPERRPSLIFNALRGADHKAPVYDQEYEGLTHCQAVHPKICGPVRPADDRHGYTGG